MERFFTLSNPLFWMFWAISWLLTGLILLWRNVIWCRKRFYWHIYDFYCFKKEIKKGIDLQKIINIESWICREKRKTFRHLYLKEIESLVNEAKIKILNEEVLSE